MTIREKCEAAKNAAPTLAQADAATRNGAILKMARYLRGEANAILAANETGSSNRPEPTAYRRQCSTGCG